MIEFDPSTWAKGAAAILDEATAFHTSASSTLRGTSDVAALGAAGGATVVDQAIATAMTPMFDLLRQTIDSLTQGLGQEAELMRQTGAAYAATEDANRDLARGAGEV